MENLSKLPERLKELMVEKEISSQQLAVEIGVQYAAINRYLRGLRIPKYETLVALVEYFDCSADFLLGLSDYPKREEQIFHQIQAFPVQLRKALCNLGITQYALHRKTKISTANFNDWNHGYSRPRADNLVKLALALECSVDFLLGRET